MNTSNKLTLIFALLVVFTASDVFGQGRRGTQGHGNQLRSGTQTGRYRSGRQGNVMGQGQQRQRQNGQGQMGQGQNGQRGDDSLSAAQRQHLILMREEEKLARDVYNAMKAKWGTPVFARIARSESQHMNAMASLLSRYHIPDPVTDNTAGRFTAVQFQNLYKTLVASGSNSLVDALKVGLKIEEMDIADLRAAIRSTSNPDIARVYEHLERASRNHLRAFAGQLKKAGGTYNATSLSQAEFDQIANGQQQRAGGQGHDGGKNRGRGNMQRQNGRGNAQGQEKGRRGGNGRDRKKR